MKPDPIIPTFNFFLDIRTPMRFSHEFNFAWLVALLPRASARPRLAARRVFASERWNPTTEHPPDEFVPVTAMQIDRLNKKLAGCVKVFNLQEDLGNRVKD